MYCNGVKQDGGSTKEGSRRDDYSLADGTVLVGKYGNFYSSVAIDELLFFNNKLRDAQINELYDQGYTKMTKTIN